ncbi:MAG TPA: 4Fe-4S dicluster domain-containing protein [Myxococcaceae bacterium]|nr:4Fe-4S dicluster domain-containing protein [Myxococcaceae bacterium]
MNRRGLLGALGAVAAAAALPRRARASAPALRPPGALAPGSFEEACIGCFRCAEVCPPKAIRFPAAFSLQAVHPFIDAREHACILCMRCTEVCPTAALVPVPATPGDVARTVRMGTPVLERRDCLPWNGRGVCRLCYYVCPYAGTAVELVGPRQAPLFHAEACVGCGLCEEACPADGPAIRIRPRGAAAGAPG